MKEGENPAFDKTFGLIKHMDDRSAREYLERLLSSEQRVEDLCKSLLLFEHLYWQKRMSEGRGPGKRRLAGMAVAIMDLHLYEKSKQAAKVGGDK